MRRDSRLPPPDSSSISQSISTSSKSSKSTKSGKTVPDYSVEEDRFGRLVNKEKRLVWPSVKPLNQKEFKTFLKTPPDPTKDSPCSPLSEQASEVVSDRRPAFTGDCITFHEKYSGTPEEDKAFYGAATVEEMERVMKGQKSTLMLYYRKSSDENTAFSSPVSLFLIYRDGRDGMHHFPVLRRSIKRGNFVDEWYLWRVDYGDKNAREFTSLTALMKYYQLFSYYDPKTGLVEPFPKFEEKK